MADNPGSTPGDPRERQLILRYWGWSLGIVTMLLILYRTHPWYVRTLGSPSAPLPDSRVQVALLVIYLGYVLTFVSAPFRGDISGSKMLLIGDFLESLPRRLRRHLWGPQPPYSECVPITPETRTALHGLLVKAYFLPVMLNFFLQHTGGFRQAGLQWVSPTGTRNLSTTLDVLFQVLFMIDTGIFVYGYAVESEHWGTRIRSVEPTLFGWMVALACYPPFNDASSQILPTDGGRIWLIQDASVLLGFRVVAFGLYCVYVWASVALGTRASNLTNRGIVGWGPYRYVRHPAYIAKNLAWWFEKLPMMASPVHAVGLLLFNAVYIVRALTEERHLGADPDYVAYCRKVPYRFIPGVF